MPAEGPPSRGSSGGALNRTQGSPSVMQEPHQPPVDPEVLALGTSAPDRTLRNALIVLVAALAVVAAGLVAWRIMPHPDPPITLDDLEGVYAGMVRSDGLNDASVLHRQSPSRNDASVDPAACLPLFDTTAFNQFPVEALDGVGTYWLVEPSAISLFTFRFADAQAADRAYRRVTAALSGCAGRQVRVSEPSAATGDLSRIEVTRAGGARPQ